MKTMLLQIQYTSIIITYFVSKMQAIFLGKYIFLCLFLIKKIFYFFSFLIIFIFLVLNYFLLLLITISLFLLIFIFFIIIIFSLNMHVLCPTFGYCTNHPKNLIDILCFKCGYYKIILTKLIFIL